MKGRRLGFLPALAYLIDWQSAGRGGLEVEAKKTFNFGGEGVELRVVHTLLAFRLNVTVGLLADGGGAGSAALLAKAPMLLLLCLLPAAVPAAAAFAAPLVCARRCCRLPLLHSLCRRGAGTQG